MKALGAALPAVALALLPKCPMCFASYVAALSALGVHRLPTGPLWAMSIATLAVALGFVARAALVHKRPGAFALSASGALLVLAGRWAEAPLPVLVAGVAILYVGARGARKKTLAETRLA